MNIKQLDKYIEKRMGIRIEDVLADEKMLNVFRDCNGYLFKKVFPKFELMLDKKLDWLKTENFHEKLWNWLHKREGYPKCEVCGNDIIEFYRFTDRRGYKNHCSIECSRITRKRKAEKTCLERYGELNFNMTEVANENRKKAMLTKYGVEHHLL